MNKVKIRYAAAVWVLALCGLARADRFDAFDSAGQSDVPAAFVYSPIAGVSAENRGSARLLQKHDMGTVEGSFTFEAYVRPDTIPNQTVPILCAGVEGEKNARCFAGLRWLSNFKQCYWGGGVTPEGKKNRVQFSTGHFVSISRLSEKTIGWRHIALVYDAKAMTVSVCLDHWQKVTHQLHQPLPKKLNLWINDEFDGLVDSARVVSRPLPEELFLRATPTKLSKVSFDHRDRVFPADAGHLSVKRNFGAVGDGVVDDTVAIQNAFRALANHQASGATYVLHFPAGTYLVSDTVKWSRFLRVQGEGRDKTKIVLRDRCEGFGDRENPRPVVAASAVRGRPGSNKAVNGSTIANWFHGFTVDSGSGNPGAIGVEYHSNNYGSLEDVTIVSGDGSGVVGLDLSHKTNGPTLIANTRVEGFDTGILSKYLEYSITMEDVELTGQKKVGISNGGNILALHRIKSHNTVPAIRSSGGSGVITILNSTFTGGDGANAAVEVGGGIYARNVKVGGYGKSIAQTINSWNPHRKPSNASEQGATLVGDIDEFIGDKTIHPNGSEVTALALPIKDAPITPRGDFASDWVNVQDFARLVVVDGKQEDWTRAIEAAFATGKPTVYFPRGGRYSVSRPISVPATVKRLYGMDIRLEQLGLADSKDVDYPNLSTTLSVDDDTDDPLTIEFLATSLEHSSRRPIVLQHGRFIYRAKPGAGDVFIRDVVSPWWSFVRGQSVWARQWNVESHSVTFPCITADGTNIWSLGFKTEYESQKLRATGGSAVELYGSFIYPVVKGIPEDRPVFEIIDSKFAAQWALSVYSAGHFLQVRDVKNGVVRDTTVKNGKQLGPRRRFDFYSNQ